MSAPMVNLMPNPACSHAAFQKDCERCRDYNRSAEVLFDPLGAASVEAMTREGDEWEVAIHVRLSAEQAEMFFKRFVVNKESLCVRMERGL